MDKKVVLIIITSISLFCSCYGPVQHKPNIAKSTDKQVSLVKNPPIPIMIEDLKNLSKKQYPGTVASCIEMVARFPKNCSNFTFIKNYIFYSELEDNSLCLVCYDYSEKKEIWREKKFSFIRIVAIDGRVAEIYGNDGTLLVNIKSGLVYSRSNSPMTAYSNIEIVEDKYLVYAQKNTVDDIKPSSTFYCCLFNSGKILWKKEFGSPGHFNTMKIIAACDNKAIVRESESSPGDGSVVLQSFSLTLRNMATGDELKNFHFKMKGYMSNESHPIEIDLGQGKALLSESNYDDADSVCYMFDIPQQKVIWSRNYATIGKILLVKGDSIYALGTKGYSKIDAKTGKINWSLSLGKKISHVKIGILIDKCLIQYFSGDGFLVTVDDRTGKIMSRENISQYDRGATTYRCKSAMHGLNISWTENRGLLQEKTFSFFDGVWKPILTIQEQTIYDALIFKDMLFVEAGGFITAYTMKGEVIWCTGYTSRSMGIVDGMLVLKGYDYWIFVNPSNGKVTSIFYMPGHEYKIQYEKYQIMYMLDFIDNQPGGKLEKDIYSSDESYQNTLSFIDCRLSDGTTCIYRLPMDDKY